MTQQPEHDKPLSEVAAAEDADAIELLRQHPVRSPGASPRAPRDKCLQAQSSHAMIGAGSGELHEGRGGARGALWRLLRVESSGELYQQVTREHAALCQGCMNTVSDACSGGGSPSDHQLCFDMHAHDHVQLHSAAFFVLAGTVAVMDTAAKAVKRTTARMLAWLHDRVRGQRSQPAAQLWKPRAVPAEEAAAEPAGEEHPTT